MSLEQADQAAAAVAKAPRVSLDDIKASIETVTYLHGSTLVKYAERTDHMGKGADVLKHVGSVTVCMVVMKNGWVILGKSAPAHPDNFDNDLGIKLAYEDALRQIWPLMGFALRDVLHREGYPNG